MTGECWLEIPVPPIVEPSENVAAQIGDDVTISCRLTSGKPAPSIRWYFQGNGDEYGLCVQLKLIVQRKNPRSVTIRIAKLLQKYSRTFVTFTQSHQAKAK